jgi:poly(3-hydroxybutyrate) depolymerase
LSATGSIFTPTGCKDEAGAKKCKMMVLFHGCGGNGSYETGYWRRAAENNNVILIAPSVQGQCWDANECYTDARFC